MQNKMMHQNEQKQMQKQETKAPGAEAEAPGAEVVDTTGDTGAADRPSQTSNRITRDRKRCQQSAKCI